MPCALIIGATGILAPAVDTLTSRGWSVLAVARSEQRLRSLRSNRPLTYGAVHTLAADAEHPSFLRLLERRLRSSDLTLSATALYAPVTAVAVATALTKIVDGPIVEVLTSGIATPAFEGDRWSIDRLGGSGPTNVRLVLGWRREFGTTRWHTPEEISAAVVATLADPRDRLLGTVTPWSERP